ncbi:MAG: DUF2339 domain-containing protein [Patescibacteria group bacterium]
MEFFTFIGGIVILIFVLNLRGRVRKLEQFIKMGAVQRASTSAHQPLRQSFESETSQSSGLDSLHGYIRQQIKQGVGKEEIKNSLIDNGWQASDIEQALNMIPSSVQSSRSIIEPIQIKPTLSEKFVGWLKEDWLLKLGALLLLIGFGWLTTYAFLNNWVGPMGRIALGIVAGALFLVLGWWRIKAYIHQGGIFLVLGSTTMLLTIFAAREMYDYFTPLSALAVMFLTTAFVAFISVTYRSKSLALASLILAGIAPLLTNAPTTDYIGLFSYLFVVVLGAIWIVALTGNRELTAAALILVGLYSLPHLFSLTLADRGTLLLFAYAFAGVFFLTNTAGILKLKGKEIIPDLIAAAGNGLFLLAWIMIAAQDEWRSLIISAWMIVFGIGAFLVFKITQRKEPFYVYAGVGIAMLAAATSVELKGATLVIAYTIESGIIALVTYVVLRDIKIAVQASLLLVGPVILSLGSITSRAWMTGVIHKDFFVLFILGLTLLGLGLFFLSLIRKVQDKELHQTNTILLIAGSIYFYVLLWLSLHAGLRNDNTAVMISLVIYTIIGIISYLYGLAHEKRVLQLYGGTLIGFVVGRLLLVDVWKMELAGRIVTFFLVGALLVSTAFLGKKKKGPDLPVTI